MFVAFFVGIGYCYGLICRSEESCGVVCVCVHMCVSVCLIVGILQTGGLGPIWTVATETETSVGQYKTLRS
jgi:hypothetical protein